MALKIRKKLLFLFFMFLTLFLLKGEGFSFEIDENAQKGILSNGAIYILKNLPKDNRIVSLRILVKTGSSTEDGYWGSGISHFVEHMVFKGTKKRSVGEIEKEVKSLGGYINAHTSIDSTIYEINIPSEYIKNAIEILDDMLFSASFDEGEFKKEKEVILKEIRMREDNPSQYINRLLYENIYLNHPYKFPIIGYESVLKKLTRSDLVNYYSEKYSPSNMIIGIAGDFDVEKMKKDIEEVFGKEERKISKPRTFFEEPPINGPREFKEYYETPLCHILIGFQGTDIDSNDLYALDVLALILGQGSSSRLVRSLVEEKRIAYQVASWSYTPLDKGVFGILLTCEPDKYEKAIHDVFSEIEKIKLKGVSEKELGKAKKAILADYIFSLESSKSQSLDLVTNLAYTGNAGFSKLYRDRIDKLNLLDIQIAANKYLSSENFVKVALFPKKFEKKEILTSQIPKSGEIKKIVLSNGINLLLKSDKTLPIVNLTAIFEGGTRFEDPSKNGVSALMADMLFSGTKTKSEKEISGILDRNGIEASPFSGSNSFGIKMKFLGSDRDIALRLFSDLIKNSVFPKSEFEKELSKQIAAIKMEESDVFGLGMKSFRKLLYKVHPYMNSSSGTIETLENLKREDCMEFYKDYCGPQNMTLSIFGDIDIEKTEDEIRNLFKDFKKSSFPKKEIPEEPGQNKLRKNEVKLEKKEALLLVGVKSTTIKDKDRYALEVLASIMSGQDGRLFSIIRSSVGISYSLGSSSLVGIDPGFFIFYVATTKENLNKSENIILNEIEKLKKGDISEEEIRNAKANLVGDYLMALETLSSLSFTASSDELFGLGYDNYKSYEKNINEVSKDDIEKIIQKYFQSDKLNIIKVMSDGKI